MGKYFLGSVGKAEAFRRDADGKLNLAFVSKTLTDSGLNISTTKDDIRAGTGAPIQFSFYHDSNVEITLTDVLWKKEYLEAQIGANFIEGGDAYYTDKQVATSAGSLTVEKEPKKLPFACVKDGDNPIVGWFSEVGKDEWHAGTFGTGAASKTLTAYEAGDIKANTEYCIRYLTNNEDANIAEITATIVPEELFLIITAPLFAGDACEASKGKAAGYITFEVPRFQLNGAQDFAMNMSQNQTMSLAGIALAGASEDCEAMGGKLLRIIEVISSADFTKEAVDIIIDEDCLFANRAINAFTLQKDGHIRKITDPADSLRIKKSGEDEWKSYAAWPSAGNYTVKLTKVSEETLKEEVTVAAAQ